MSFKIYALMVEKCMPFYCSLLFSGLKHNVLKTSQTDSDLAAYSRFVFKHIKPSHYARGFKQIVILI